MTKLEKTLTDYECPEHANYVINRIILTGFKPFPDARNFERTISKLKRTMNQNKYAINLFSGYMKACSDKKSEEYVTLVGKVNFVSAEQRLLRNIMTLLIETRNQYSTYTRHCKNDYITGYERFIDRLNRAVEITNKRILKKSVKQDSQMSFNFKAKTDKFRYESNTLFDTF